MGRSGGPTPLKDVFVCMCEIVGGIWLHGFFHNFSATRKNERKNTLQTGLKRCLVAPRHLDRPLRPSACRVSPADLELDHKTFLTYLENGVFNFGAQDEVRSHARSILKTQCKVTMRCAWRLPPSSCGQNRRPKKNTSRFGHPPRGMIKKFLGTIVAKRTPL